MAIIGSFTTNIKGSGLVGAELWVDLGLIPTGKRIWIGNAQYTSPNKSSTFELRTNNATKTTGTIANTTLKDSVVASVRSGTITRDLYKNGTLHTVTIYGTGVEHWWLRIFSKTSTSSDYLFSINYTTE